MKLISETTICVSDQVSKEKRQYANELITKERVVRMGFYCTYGHDMG